MQLALVRLPLTAQQLAALGDQGFALIDQAASTPGLLIVQRPDPQALAEGEGDGNTTHQPSD